MRDGGTAAFEAIASALNFRHHEGSKVKDELDVIKRILVRENLISEMDAICHEISEKCTRLQAEMHRKEGSCTDKERKNVKNPVISSLTLNLLNLCSVMRNVTVCVVESVEKWARSFTDQEVDDKLPSFYYRDENYLHKMCSDIDFMHDLLPDMILDEIGISRHVLLSNPFMISFTLKEISSKEASIDLDKLPSFSDGLRALRGNA